MAKERKREKEAMFKDIASPCEIKLKSIGRFTRDY